jgi:hypothetical protein
MNAVTLSRWFTGSPSPKELRSAIANDPIQHLNAVFGPLPAVQPGDPSPHYQVADRLSANQVRLAGMMAIVLRF